MVQAAKAAKKKTTGKSEAEKDAADSAFIIEKKKFKELKLTLKMIRDQEAQRVKDAKAAAQAAIDAAKAVKLDGSDKVALLQEIGKVTEIENPSDDAEEAVRQ